MRPCQNETHAAFEAAQQHHLELVLDAARLRFTLMTTQMQLQRTLVLVAAEQVLRSGADGDHRRGDPGQVGEAKDL